MAPNSSEDQSGSRRDGPHADLHRLRSRLQEILDSIHTFEPPIRSPPVLDVSLTNDDSARAGGVRGLVGKTAVPGLRALEESVRRDLDVLTKFLTDSGNQELPPLSTNAPYLVAVWDEVLAAPPPAVGIWSTFPDPGGPSISIDDAAESGRKRHKSQDVKIDVVADGGLSWVRVNTIKNSKILAEFREIDSYLTDSGDDDDDDEEDSSPSRQLSGRLLNENGLDNSVIRMGRSLISAAKLASASLPTPPNDVTTETATSNSSNTQIPRIQVTVRLTRLNPSPSDSSLFDPRIPRTIKALENMGIQVKLGESNPIPPPPPSSPRVFLPTTKVNLDLSLLVALISDITHTPLPKTHKDAEERFVPPASYLEWKKKRLEEAVVQESSEDDLDENSSGVESGGGRPKKRKVKLPGQGKPESVKHSRALANQTKQEMESAILEEIRSRLLQTVRLVHGDASSLKDVEFWTTAEARARCLRIASKISGTRERERAKALLFAPAPESGSGVGVGLKEASELYWKNSRYDEGYLPLLPVQVFPQTASPPSKPTSPYEPPPSLSRSPFFHQLVKTCTHVLAQDIVPHPRSLPSHITSDILASPSLTSTTASAIDTPELEGLSLLGDDGGEIQRATVTKANPKLTAHTVESLLEGAKRGWTTLTANKHSVKEILKEVKASTGGYYVAGAGAHECEGSEGNWKIIEDGEGNIIEAAAIWVIDPRSLAEIMSADYVPPTPPSTSLEERVQRLQLGGT